MTILRIEHNPHTHTVRLTGELDHASAPDLVTMLALNVDGASDLKLDLRGLTFMDSTGLHIIVNVAKALAGHATLVLIGPTSPVARVLDITGIVDRIPNIEVVADAPSPEEAPHEVARARDPGHPVG
jgi:anti-anti-sigma factor